MEQILFINACVRTESRTRSLADYVLSLLHGQVTTVDLNSEHIPLLDAVQLEARNTYLAQGKSDAPMLRYARQFAQADTILIAAPYWDLMFPALLKVYLEAVTVSGITFRYNERGIPESLCRAKRLIYVTTAGGPIGDYDFGFQYVSTMAHGFFGIHNVQCVRADGLDIVGADVENILAQARKQADDLLR